jgi:PAS domain S-box-containing protein
MPKPPPSPLLRYGVVCLAVAGAMLLRWPLWPVLGPNMPELLLWPVVLFCAWYGGLGAGLLATVLSALAAAYFLEARDRETAIGSAEWTGMIVFVTAGIIASGLAAWWSRSQRKDVSNGEWLRATISSIGDAVIATDSQGRITFFNPVASQLTGWDPEEAVGKHLDAVFQIVHEQTRQVIENPVPKVLLHDTVVSLPPHTVLVSKDGSERPVEGSAAPIRDDAGEVIGAVLVFHDITGRRQMEKELRQKADKLIEVDHHKEGFLAMLAKELQNPVPTILQGLEKLPLTGPDRQTVEQVRHTLEQQFRHVSQLVEDLVDVVRLTR